MSTEQYALGIALLSGRGEILEAADLPASPEDVLALRDLAVDLINSAARQHAFGQAIKEMSVEVLGAMRAGTATHLARMLVLCDPVGPQIGTDEFKERSQDVRAALLDEAWPIDEERL